MRTYIKFIRPSGEEDLVKCDTLDKAHRKYMQSIGKGGLPPECHPTKKHTSGRLRHYDFDETKRERAIRNKMHHENLLQQLLRNAQTAHLR